MHEQIKSKTNNGNIKRYRETYTKTQLIEAITSSLCYVEVAHDNNTIMILCESNINSHGPMSVEDKTISTAHLYDKLPTALKKMCGRVPIPPDGGKQLLENIKKKNTPLIGVSDASLHKDQCSHAWIICSGNIDDVNDPNMHISGEGIVDGPADYLSSTRGEAQGQAALAVMASIMLKANDSLNTPIKLVGDNKGVQTKTAKKGFYKLRHHREANADIFLEYHQHAKTLNKTIGWVKGHLDADTPWATIQELKDLKLSPEATMNIWCDSRAAIARNQDITIADAEVLPAEKWALYSTYPNTKKITGDLTEGILCQLHHEAMEHYIRKKHGLCEGKLKHIHTEGLSNYMRKLKVHQRATISKIIHRWIPTFNVLHKQNRAPSNICTRCNATPETPDHILECTNKEAITARKKLLYEALETLEGINTGEHILSALEKNLARTMKVPQENRYRQNHASPNNNTTLLTKALHHQNLVGWRQALRGYISRYWIDLQSTENTSKKNNKKQPRLEHKLTGTLLNLHKKIWEDRNQFIHGKTIMEQ